MWCGFFIRHSKKQEVLVHVAHSMVNPATANFFIKTDLRDSLSGVYQPPQIVHDGENMQCSLGTLKAHERVPLEQHDQDQVVCMISGAIKVLDHAGVQHKVHEGCVAFIPGGAAHSLVHIGRKTSHMWTVYSGRAHEGASYQWPTQDEPVKHAHQPAIKVYDPIQVGFRSKHTFQIDVQCTPQTSFGIAVIPHQRDIRDVLAQNDVYWNREGYYFVFSGSGTLEVFESGQSVKEDIGMGDMIYCNPLDPKDSYTFSPLEEGESKAIYMFYVTSNRRTAHQRPPLACNKQHVPYAELAQTSMHDEGEFTTVHPPVPPPLPVIFSTAQAPPVAVFNSARQPFLDEIRTGRSLRPLDPNKPRHQNTITIEQTLADAVKTAMVQRREFLEEQTAAEDEDGFED